jgi:two-component system, sensor histidine kinase
LRHGSKVKSAASQASVETLLHENEKLRKINQALMKRVETNVEMQTTSAFGLFQTAVVLEKSVRERTAELSRLNAELRDQIDERTELVEALRVAKRMAEHANAVKTRFLAAISHDLMQPLNAARLFVDAVSERSHDHETMEILQNIDASLSSADRLISSLLEISRLDLHEPTVEVTDFPIRQYLSRIVAEYAAEAKRRRLEIHLCGPETMVRTDPRLLERIVRNLLSNALRYTPRGRIMVACRPKPSGLRLEVRDSGIGIPQEQLTEIFEEFKQLDVAVNRDDAGVGLGLAIVDRIGKLLQLPIDVRAEIGRGSVFAVEIPYAPAAGVTRGTPEKLSNGELPFAGRRAIILERDAESADAMYSLFSQLGGEAFTATGTDDALTLLSSVCSSPDVLLADCGDTGLEAIAAIRTRLSREVPALLVVNEAAKDERRQAKESNVFVLTKPVHAARLRSLLLHALSPRSAMN